MSKTKAIKMSSILNNQVQYSLILISEIARRQKLGDTYIPLHEIAGATDIPLRFAARIASRLVYGGLLESREGRIGGYKIGEINGDSLFSLMKLFGKPRELKGPFMPIYWRIVQRVGELRVAELI